MRNGIKQIIQKIFPKKQSSDSVITMEYSDEEIDIQRAVQMISDPAKIMKWLKRHAEPEPMSPLVDISVAPMGIAAYGIKEEADGRYSIFTVTTNAVRGIVDIPPNISVSSYRWNGSRCGQDFSVQLNAFVIADLKNRMREYYWVQNVVVPDEKHENLEVLSNIWNVTTSPAILRARGRCKNGKKYRGNYYCFKCDPIPFGRVELTTSVRVDGGKVIVEFYANELKYDEVVITPNAPATSAYIAIAPIMTPLGNLLNLELVLGGHDVDTPYAVLHDGRIGLKLYIRENGKWVPPPSAWSIGIATAERSHARVVKRDIGSVVVEPGEPNLQQLW